MEKAKQQLQALIDSGNRFTFKNFSDKSSYGYTSSYKPEWVAWRTRCRSVINKLFGPGSPQDNAMDAAFNVVLIGNGEDKFKQCQSYVIGALTTALEVLENDVFGELATDKASAPRSLSNKVFIVHGHDEAAKASLEVFLSEIGLEPVVLHRQADEGQTIIEKFEKHSDVGYAFILLTPDEMAYLAKYHGSPEKEKYIENRARPNVIFEFGFFVGKLGRSRVCCLYTGGVTLPTDVSGMIYKEYSNSIEEVAYNIIKDLKVCGYKLK
jgi:predicted nucleotide-binding protein